MNPFASIPAIENAAAPWPGYFFPAGSPFSPRTSLIITPDIKRFLEEAELIVVETRRGSLVASSFLMRRLPGPLSRPT